MAFRGGILTSGRRTPEGNRAVGGARNSNHLRGDAVDYDGPNLQQVLRAAREYYKGTPAKPAIHNGNHVHVDLPGYGKVPYYGKNGTKGRGR